VRLFLDDSCYPSFIEIAVVQSIAEVSAEAWDALAGEDDPFLEHAFLSTLEASDSVSARAGCVPRLVLARDDGKLVGAVPLYLKTNSQGEFIFDWGWADASERSGVPYYPKLVAAIPFTPATGRRLLVAPGATDAGSVVEALLGGVDDVAKQERASSVHVLFCTDDEKRALAARHYLPRLSLQFHWHNRPERPFESFEDYLSTFRSRNRKQVRKEREAGGRARPRPARRDGSGARGRRLARAAPPLPHERAAAPRHPLPHAGVLRARARDAGPPPRRDARDARDRDRRRGR
jgi:predicted N-acyltransferase